MRAMDSPLTYYLQSVAKVGQRRRDIFRIGTALPRWS
jgi:hypothetical protein